MHRYDYTRKPGATELVPFRTYACKWALAHGRSSRPLISPTTAADNKVAMARKDYQLNALIAGFGHPSRGETEAVTTQNLEVVFSRQSARKIPIMVRLSPSPCVRQSILTPLRGQVIDLTGRRSGNSCASSPIFFPEFPQFCCRELNPLVACLHLGTQTMPLPASVSRESTEQCPMSWYCESS